MRRFSFRRLSLWQRFALAAAIVLFVGSVVIGRWVSDRISEEVTHNAAISSALLVDGLISPLAQELGTSDVLSIGPVRALDEVMANRALRDRMPSIKIWKPDGQLAYGNNLDLIGQSFPVTDALARAVEGEVVAEFDRLDEAESSREQALGRPMLEIYSPVRDQWTGEVIAVAEFYEDATALSAALGDARRSSWLVVGGTTATMALLLFGIVYQGSRTIERQRMLLEKEIDRVAAVSQQNMALRKRVERAYSLSSELNERYLRRVSADLHDGPAQLVGLASLRVGSLRDSICPDSRADEAARIAQVLGEAMTDIRNICAGLSLPKIEAKSVAEIVSEAVHAHERRTGMHVDTHVSGEVPAEAVHIKICVYRFVQEGLNNAYRHAPGSRQTVDCHVAGGVLSLKVQNGPYVMNGAMAAHPGGQLGLEGLRGRVEALCGQFEFKTSPESGSDLEMSVRLDEVAA